MGNGSRMLHKARKKYIPCSNALNYICFRILSSLGILKGYNQCSHDVISAHAHVPPPKRKTYLKSDDAIKEFYERHFNRKLLDDEVLPIIRMLQGHLEASGAWDACIIQILERIGFKHTTHEPSTSRAIINNKEVLLARQVDAFRFAAENKETVDQVLQLLKNDGVHVDYVDQPQFNGLDIDERREYVRLHFENYMQKSIEKLDFKAHLNYAKLQNFPITDAIVKDLEDKPSDI